MRFSLFFCVQAEDGIRDAQEFLVFKQKTAYEMLRSLVGSEMCIRDSVKAFFDSVPWDLMIKALERHTDQKWVRLYVARWLKAPMLMPDGTMVARVKGTPQGGPISPLIANIFLHHGFDAWMTREYPGVQFERFADDVVVHCVTERQARQVREAIGRRLAEIGLELHPDKTRIVYCKDGMR